MDTLRDAAPKPNFPENRLLSQWLKSKDGRGRGEQSTVEIEESVSALTKFQLVFINAFGTKEAIIEASGQAADRERTGRGS